MHHLQKIWLKLTIKQICDFVQIDFKVGDLDVELEVLLHRIDVVEDVVDNPGYDAQLVGVVDDALHGVGLAARGLTIGEYGSIVSTQHI